MADPAWQVLLKFLLAPTNNRLVAVDQVEAESCHVEWTRTSVSTLYCVEVFPP
jgi:hypothetical protein